MGKFIDITGQKFSRLTALSCEGADNSGRIRWACECDCGKSVVVPSASLRSGNTQSCGCLQREKAAKSGMASGINLTGEKFSRLTALARIGSGEQVKTQWLCRCDCGNEIIAASGNLRSGHTRSCGCLRVEIGVERNTKHGMCESSEYSTWESMKKRCVNPNHKYFHNYGGRGIKVCERWRNSFENFYADMGPKPDPRLTLERIDNNGNYEPSNCCWATRAEQRSNTRNSGKYKRNGVENV